jgi:hypothetical protein
MNQSYQQCQPGEKKATYLVKEKQDERLEEIAYWDRKKKKQVIQEALDLYISTKSHLPKLST